MRSRLIIKKKMIPCPCSCGEMVLFYWKEFGYVKCPECGFDLDCRGKEILGKEKETVFPFHFRYYYWDSTSIIERVKVTCNGCHGFFGLYYSWFLIIPNAINTLTVEQTKAVLSDSEVKKNDSI